MPESLLHSEMGYRFYAELKHRMGEVLEENESSHGFELNSVKFLFVEGFISVYKNGEEIWNCSVDDFSRHTSATSGNLGKARRNRHK